MKRILVGAAAVLLVCATSPAAWSETDIVLHNESQDTEVRTGKSTFTNSESVSSSATMDPPAAGNAPVIVSEPRIATTALVEEPGPALGATETEPEVVSDARNDTESVEALFVGLAPAVGAVL
jgi:hypothetical protein